MRGLLHCAVAVLGAWSLVTAARAQSYPSKLVRIVVAYAPGGATDVVTRAVAQRLGPLWNQPVVIENKAGANTNIAAEAVAKMPPDGHALLSTAEATFAVNPHVYGKLPFDPVRDFVPVSGLGIIHQVLVVHPSVPMQSIGDLIAQARAKPGGIHYATLGVGSSPHLNMEMFQHMAGVSLAPVHYKGGAPALADVVGGHVPTMFISTTLMAKPWKAGQLKVLGVGSAKRLAQFPELPTIAESGLPGFEAVSWFGLFAPGATPREVVTKINADVQRVLADPDFRDKFLAPNFFEPIAGSPEEFANYVKRDAAKWGQVVKQARVTLD